MDITLLLAMIVVVVTGVIFGMTGFGFALVSVPPLLLLYEPDTVVALTIGASLLTSVIVVGSARRALDARLVVALLPGALVGLLVGARILEVVDATLLKFVAGTLVAGYSLSLLAGFEPRIGAGILPTTLAGAASGALSTSTGLSGPPIVILFTDRGLAKDAFRVTIAAYFTLLNIAGFAILLAGGTIGEREVVTTVVLTPAAGLGALAGNHLVRRVTAAGFRRLTLALLLLTGLMGIATAIVALR